MEKLELKRRTTSEQKAYWEGVRDGIVYIYAIELREGFEPTKTVEERLNEIDYMEEVFGQRRVLNEEA